MSSAAQGKVDREIELKLELGHEDARALRGHPLLADPSSAQTQVTTYYDTEKEAVRRAGFSLRVRQAGDLFLQTIKQDAPESAGLFDRPEWEEQVEDAKLDFQMIDGTPLGAILTAKRRKNLQPVLVSTVTRTIWHVDRAGSRIELSLDEGTLASGASEQPICELEIELKSGEAAALFDFAREIGRDLPVKLGVLTKAGRGAALASGALSRVAKAEPVHVEPGMTVGEAFATIVYNCLKHFRLNEALVLVQRDPAALHQARVAMRRLRSALSLFGPVIRDEAFEALREELRWFTGQLGDARNLDVLLHRFADAPIADSARASLETARGAAYDRVVAAIGSQRFRDLMINLVAWVELGAWRQEEAAAAPILPFAVQRIDSRWRKVKKAGRDLKALDEEPRHQLRIDIKKLRYALEFLSGLIGKEEAKSFLAGLAKMQEELGSLNDFATARELLVQIPGLSGETIPQPTKAEERKHVAKAQRAFEKLAVAGRFWRDAR